MHTEVSTMLLGVLLHHPQSLWVVRKKRSGINRGHWRCCADDDVYPAPMQRLSLARALPQHRFVCLLEKGVYVTRTLGKNFCLCQHHLPTMLPSMDFIHSGFRLKGKKSTYLPPLGNIWKQSGEREPDSETNSSELLLCATYSSRCWRRC